MKETLSTMIFPKGDPDSEKRVSSLPNDDLPKQIAIISELRAGDWCPNCGKARLDYDSLLNLGCPACKYTLAGCFT